MDRIVRLNTLHRVFQSQAREYRLPFALRSLQSQILFAGRIQRYMPMIPIVYL